ncbi:hypothetical protein [Pseudomonas sp. LG1D9]|uniref:hypothetical protein n=1 Tax=Pseudomonas sp. LG1D9 TaxID=2083054 RepID=UPI0015AD1EB7|nr:hypothetical protein [Pseudomonas sp. LG1D9]
MRYDRYTAALGFRAAAQPRAGQARSPQFLCIELLDKAQGTQALVDIPRGLIGKALAERWFLSFER